MPYLLGLRVLVMCEMIMAITSDRPWGYRKRYWRRRCFNCPCNEEDLPPEDDLSAPQDPSFSTEECSCQETIPPETTCPPPATIYVTERTTPLLRTMSSEVTQIQFYLILGAGLGGFVFGVVVTIAIHALIQRNKIATEKKLNKIRRNEVSEQAGCGYKDKRNRYQVPSVSQGIYFYDRVEEDELYENVR